MIQRLKAAIRQSAPMVFLIDVSKRIRLPGFDKLPLYDVIVFFIEGLQKGSLTIRASSLAYRFFLALFPLTLLLFSIIPYLPIDNFQNILLRLIETELPRLYEFSESTLHDLVRNRRGSLLSFGFILTFYFSTNGIIAMMHAFNQSYFSTEKRNFIKQRLVALGLLVILTIMVITAVTLIIFSKGLVGYLEAENILPDSYTVFFFLVIKWVVVLTLIYFSYAIIYYYGPSRKTKWRFWSAGSSLSTTLTIVVSLGFAWFVQNFGQWNKLYGSIGSLIVLMLWMYFNALILLIGFELNASIQKTRQERLLGEE